MSIDFGGWLAGGGSLVATQIPLRAQIQWARIQDKASDVSFKRNGVDLAPQTVRIELHNTVTDATDMSGVSTFRDAIVFGIHGHPELDDTDVEVWDTFVMNDVEFTIVNVNRHLLGQVQAYAEAVG